MSAPYPTKEDMNPGMGGPPPPYFAPNYDSGNAQAQPPMAGFIPQGHGAPHPHPQGYTTTTIISAQPQAPGTSVIITTGLPRSFNSARLTCPYCQADVNTSVDYESGAMTHIIALLLCLFACWPCCLIPYCVDGCKDTIHRCPNCRRDLGMVKRI